MVVVLNPVSGTGHGVSRRDAIAAAFAARGAACRIVETTPRVGAGDLVRAALADGATRIAVSGGDGTVQAALAALAGTGVPLAILPAGTGNLLAKNLGVPRDLALAVETALTGVAVDLDLARTDRGQIFAIMGGIGLDGQIMAEADRGAKGRFGVLAYVWAALRNVTRHRIRVRLQIDDQMPRLIRTKSVLIANVGRLSAGLDVIPGALPDDGLLDVGVVASHTPGQVLRLLLLFFLGRAPDDPEMTVWQARRVRVVAEAPEPVQLDGEPIGAWRRLTVEVVPKAVRVWVPADARVREAAIDPLRAVTRHARSAMPGVAVTLVAAGALLWWVRCRSRSARGR